ncbi:MAG: serine hydrolase domain-containing protein, partial [Candidatus Thorarchaeota archaeon]
MTEIHGFCDEKFTVARQEFLKNFDEGLDVGASFSVTLNGKYIIDIWGGYADADKSRSWEENTIVNVWSTTKIMTTICTLMLVDQGLLNLDAPVAKYWPEFAQAGKELLPVRYLLSHTAGLSGFDRTPRTKVLYNWEKITSILAAQKPWWKPGTKSGYHLVTFGYLLGELIRRITGKTVGTYFKENVAGPLKADFYIGLSEEHDHRVADLIPPPQIDLKSLGDVDPNSIGMRSLTSAL